ncbi:cytochrome P450 [Rhodococcus qingshengii]|uniref:cytochrome P450 n=1 Tax=Rhodococcus qingshengii TaxID=334542 RepID=UPI0036D97D0B
MNTRETARTNAESAAFQDGRKVCPFDHHSTEYATGHREIFQELREAGPVVWSEAYGGFWIANDFEHASAVLQDSESFTIEAVDSDTEGGSLIPTPPKAAWLSPGNTLFNFFDGPRHETVRTALNPHFSRRRLKAMEGAIKSRVDQVLDQVSSLPEFDIVYDLASPIVAGIVNDHMGFGLDDPAPIFRAMSDQSHDKKAEVDDQAIVTFKDGWIYLGEVVRARRAEPRNDVISALVLANDGQFTDYEIQGMCTNIIFGAADTAAALTAHSLTFLADRPDLRAKLRDDPKQIPVFVREGLRYFNVAMGVARSAKRDIELGGVKIRRGDRVFALLPSANLDPARYDHPDEFDISRGAVPHLGFGAGEHTCLGAGLAQALVGAVIQAVLERVETYSIDTARVVGNSDKSFINLFHSAPMRIESLREPTAQARA